MNNNHPNSETDPSLLGPPCNGYHKISLPLLRRCVSDPYNPPSANTNSPLMFGHSSLCGGASCCGGSLPYMTPPQRSPDRHHFPKTPSHSPSSTQVLPPLPPPQTLRRTVSDINPSPAKASSRFSTSSQDLGTGTDIDTPNSKRLRRMKDRLREMSHWCQQLMREEDSMKEDEDEAVVEEEQVPTVDATDQDFHNCALAVAEDDYEKQFAESVSVEKKDECLVVHFRCQCDKAYQFLLSGGQCYYKLM